MRKEAFCNHVTMPMNLQFFAEDAPEGAETNTTPDNKETGDEEGNDNSGEKSGKTYEDALAEIAAAQAEVKKAKAERDSALKKSGELTKQLRAKMTEDEVKAEQDAEKEEERKAYVKELESYKAKNEAFKRYTMLGMDSTLAEKAADAEIAGDMDALADAFKQQKQIELKAERAKWMGERGRVNMGDGEESSMTKEQILAIEDRDERVRMMAKHLSLFQKN